jgi:hypothetical protein
MRRLTGIFMAVALALAGCASPGPQSLPEPLPPLPYRITLEFTSAIPDPYYVLSGPSESYLRVPFNSWAKGALLRRLAVRSAGVGAPEVTLRVHLVSLQTSYREVGSGPGGGVPLSSGLIGPLLLVGDDLEGGDGRHIPTEIHKGARLEAELRLDREGRSLVRKNLTPEVRETVYWEDFNDWSYDYGDVLRQVIGRLVKDVDDALQGIVTP